MSPNLTDALTGALAELHDSPHDPATWTTALAALVRAIPCQHGLAIERIGPAAEAGLGLVAGTNAEFLDEYRRTYHRVDPFAREEVVSLLHHLGRAALSGEVLRDAELQRSDYYGGFLSRYGDLFHGVGGSFLISEQTSAHIWLLRPRGHVFNADERRRMDVFFAHARVALRQRRRWLQIECERDAALASMDCARDALFVLDAQGGVTIANLSAERMLRDGEHLTMQEGRLQAAKNAEADWIGNALRALTVDARRNGGDATRCLRISSRAGRATCHAILTTVAPIPGRFADTAPRVALIVRDLREAMPQFDVEHLKDLFGFTGAEARIANALLGGQTVKTIAQAGQVRRDTIRAHVRRMLAKTGTKRQSDLQKLLVKVMPNLRSLKLAMQVEVEE